MSSVPAATLPGHPKFEKAALQYHRFESHRPRHSSTRIINRSALLFLKTHRAERYSVGVTPTMRRKIFVKWLWSEKPLLTPASRIRILEL